MQMRRIHPELVIAVALLLGIGVAAVFAIIGPQPAAVGECLETLAAVADGAVVDGRCPACSQKIAIVESAGREILRCPDPARHLKFDPRWEREPNGAWKLAFTALGEGSTEFNGPGLTRITVVGGAKFAKVRVEARPWYVWSLGLLAFLACAGLAVIGIGSGMVLLRNRSRGGAGVWIAAGIAGALLSVYVAVDAFGVTTVDVIGRSVIRRNSVFGITWRKTEIVECIGVVPAPLRGGGARFEVIHAHNEGRRRTPLIAVPEENAGAAAALNNVLKR